MLSRFKQRSQKLELLDGLGLIQENQISLIKNLKEFEFTNIISGTRGSLINGLNKIYQNSNKEITSRKIRIADIGCGGGDLTRYIYEWAKNKKLNFSVVGVDINPLTIDYARNISSKFPNIEFIVEDILSENFLNMEFDIVCLNNFCHHLETPVLVDFLLKLQSKTRIAVLINDLHRHFVLYYLVKILAYLLNWSKFAKHDGPVSVERAFTREELQSLLSSLNKSCYYSIHWRFIFRWLTIIWKRPAKDLY